MWRKAKIRHQQMYEYHHDGGRRRRHRECCLQPVRRLDYRYLLTGASFHRLDLLLATMELRVVSCIPFPRKLHVQNDTQGFVCNENKSHEVQRTGKSLLVFSLCVLRED